MKIKYKILFFSLFLFLSINLISQETNTFGETEEEIECFLGYNLTSSGVGGLSHFAIIKPLSNGEFEIIQITKDKFIRIAEGKQSSDANPKLINFFEKYEIDNPLIIGELWRLRYMNYPYHTLEQMGKGWSTNDSIPFLPTDTQMQILNKYGIKKMSDYIYGKNAFKLLHDMTNDQWRSNYKASY